MRAYERFLSYVSVWRPAMMPSMRLIAHMDTAPDCLGGREYVRE